MSGRKRILDPRFFLHRSLYAAERDSGVPCRLAFAGLWTQADRAGRFRWEPEILKLAILPWDPCDFGAVLDALDRARLVVRYEVGGEEYGVIPSFGRWQHFHQREAPSVLPAPPGTSARLPVRGRDEPRMSLGSSPQLSIGYNAELTASPSSSSQPRDEPGMSPGVAQDEPRRPASASASASKEDLAVKIFSPATNQDKDLLTIGNGAVADPALGPSDPAPVASASGDPPDDPAVASGPDPREARRLGFREAAAQARRQRSIPSEPRKAPDG